MTAHRHRTPHAPRRGQIALIVIGVIVMGVIGVVSAVLLRSGTSQTDSGLEIYAVKRGSFDIKLPCSGELVAIKQIEVRNQLNTQAVITEIVEEGKWVNVGDIVLRMNDEELQVRLNSTIDEVNLAETAVVSAAAELDIRLKERESELAKANLAVYLAELALKAWEEGEHISRMQRLELAVETKKKDFKRLKDYYDNSIALQEKDFISVDELSRDEISMMNAHSALEQAITELDIYQKYESKQNQAKKKSDLEQAQAELERTEQRFEARVRSAQSELDSRKYQLQSKKDRKRQLEQQIGYCNVAAPSSGLVVYSSSMESGRWGWGQDPPHVGSQLYPNQTVIFLPDTSQMAAEVKVSEALSGMIKIGQRATVTSEALPNLTFAGEVVNIGVLASSGGFRDPNKREYTVRIALSSNHPSLKPCMRCKADVHIESVENAVHAPIQSVFYTGPLAYVYVPDGAGYSQRKVVAGRSSELYIEIAEGLKEGERVLLRQPQPQEIIARLPAPVAESPAAAEIIADATTPLASATTEPALGGLPVGP